MTFGGKKAQFTYTECILPAATQGEIISNEYSFGSRV